jgi:hypothetical protein
MRAILVIIGLAAIVLVILMSLGMVNLRQTSTASLPSVHVEGGKAPEFKAEVGKVGIGSEDKTVKVPDLEMKEKRIAVPTIEVQKAGNAAAPAQ